MKYRVLWAIALILVLGVGTAVSAQGTPPDESPLDNACYAGGSMAGKCDWPTQAEDDWAWTCGWYIARAELGTLTAPQVPSWCGYFTATDGCINLSIARFIQVLLASGIDLGLTPEEIEELEGQLPENTSGYFPDIMLVGPVGTPDNALMFDSMDWSCTGESMVMSIIDVPGITVESILTEESDDFLDDLDAACDAFMAGTTALPISLMYNVPLTWVACLGGAGPCGCGEPMGALPERREIL